jgi:IS1016-V6 protein
MMMRPSEFQAAFLQRLFKQGGFQAVWLIFFLPAAGYFLSVIKWR